MCIVTVIAVLLALATGRHVDAQDEKSTKPMEQRPNIVLIFECNHPINGLNHSRILSFSLVVKDSHTDQVCFWRDAAIPAQTRCVAPCVSGYDPGHMGTMPESI